MGGHDGIEGVLEIGKGKHDCRVDMWFQGNYVGYALVKGAHSHRSARVAALRGIACSVYPMSDRDKVRWAFAIADRKEKP